jgi:hypothetical protein
MASDPPATTTCDHFMVFTDDANDPQPTEPEIVVVPAITPPTSAVPATNGLPAPDAPPNRKLQS